MLLSLPRRPRRRLRAWPVSRLEAGGKAMLDELARLTGALRQLRAAA